MVNTNTDDGQTISSTVTMQASPSSNDMKVNGYAFLGWITSKEVEKNGTKWNNIYDVTDDLYCTTNIKRAKPYILDNNKLVYETLDVYPVYAKWNIATKTNIEDVGNAVNIPPSPTYMLAESVSEKGEGIVTIVPNTDTYVVGNNGVKYQLVEVVRVLDDGTEEKIEKTNNEFIYNVEAGKEYVFMAKYVPYIVIYHTNINELQIESRNLLDPIGQMPSPEYEFASGNYVAIGWTDEYPGNGKYHYFQNYQEYGEEKLKIYTENSLIYESLELWPIYVRIQIKLNSNIDGILTGNGVELSNVRYRSRPTASQAQINAVEEVLDDYQFEGWYINYKSDSNKGQLLTNNTTYLLEASECVYDNIYTAVYKNGKVVNYHDKTGAVIYVANIEQDTSRTFVTEVLDNDNNVIEVPIDSKAYENIINSLDSNEIFINWQWQKQNGDIIPWENFYNLDITKSMDLYPIIRKVEVKDQEGQNVNVLVGNDDNAIKICLNDEYSKPYIEVHIEDVGYNSNGVESTNDIENVQIEVYKNSDDGQLPIATGVADKNGEATVYLYGEIIVTQQGESEDNDVFIYQILDENDNVVTEVNLSSGESKTVKVLYGNYSVKRKENWAWRYGQTSSRDFTINNLSSGKEVIFEKNKVTTKWFDATTYIDNQY